MLERFHVPPEIEVRVDPAVMRGAVEELFVALGMPRGHAEQSADVLLYADIRGIDSHGVSNMLRYYVDAIRDGSINLAAALAHHPRQPGRLHDRLGRRARRRDRARGDAHRDRAGAPVRDRLGRRLQRRALRRRRLHRRDGPR